VRGGRAPDAIGSVARVKMGGTPLRAFSGLCRGSPRLACACEEFGQTGFWWEGGAENNVALCWRGARGRCRAACAPSVRGAAAGVGVLRKQIKNE